MPAHYADEPESNWDHSHALAEGDVLFDDEGARLVVEEVYDDGSVTWVVEDEYDGEPTEVKLNDTRETFDEGEIRRALVDGIVETEDGRSAELATY